MNFTISGTAKNEFRDQFRPSFIESAASLDSFISDAVGTELKLSAAYIAKSVGGCYELTNMIILDLTFVTSLEVTVVLEP